MEIWKLVDADRNYTGFDYIRGCGDPIPKNMYYQVIEVWTIRKDGTVLLTQRHPDKFLGLKWESTGGALNFDESQIEAAQRELHEETGIFQYKNNLIYLEDTLYSNYIVISYVHIFDGQLNDLELQSEEVVGAKFVGFDDIDDLKEEMPPRIVERFMKFKSVFKELIK